MRAPIALAGAFIILGAGYYASGVGDDAYGRLQECFSKTAPRACIQTEVRALIGRDTVPEVMRRVNALVEPGRCHVTGHVIGQELYNREGDVERALAQCPGTCASSCTHGVVGQALLAVPGIGLSSEELAHPDIDLIRSEGKKLCTLRDTCHAVGHVLFQIFRDLEKALAVCEELGGTCFRGVFMESYLPEGSPDSDVAIEEKFRDPDDLLSPCSTTLPKYRRACYHFLFMNQAKTFSERGIADASEKQRLRYEACRTLPRQYDRASCLEGFGYSFLFIFPELPADAVREMCRAPESDEEKMACAFGYAHALSDFARAPEGFAYCENERNDMVKRACYQALFDSIAQRKTGFVGDACDGSSDPVCRETLEAFLEDPNDLLYDQDFDPRLGALDATQLRTINVRKQ